MTLNDWLNLLLRWAHFVAGIAWIGSSFYFVWLDTHLARPRAPRSDVDGELWMVHSGGFYLVERRRITPGGVPHPLHWFKWEAAATWATGMLLLGVVYYAAKGAYLVDPAVARIAPSAAIAVGLGAIALSWVVYDAVWRSPLARRGGRATVLSLVLLLAVTYGLTRLLSGRAAFIHVGALLGTIMAANVWMRILPAQRRMIAAAAEGRAVDWAESASAKRRSLHNSYMTLPVLFLMVSNHFPATYASRLSWLVLACLAVAGAAARHVMIARGRSRVWALGASAVGLAGVVLLTAPASTARRPVLAPARAGEPAASFEQVRAVVAVRCMACHSAHPTDPLFLAPPMGVTFDDPASIVRFAERIRVRAVETRTMPFGNRTGMTETERALLARWIARGAPGP